jgi:hypothetical protein
VELEAVAAFLREFGPVAGFPILVAFWLLRRQDKQLDEIRNMQSKILVTQVILLRTVDGVDSAEIKQLIEEDTSGVVGALPPKEKKS